MLHRKAYSAGLLTLSAIVLAAIAPAPALSVPTSQCWNITQESCTIGKVELYICDKAIKWTSPRLGLTFILRAPDWKLLGFNESTQKYMELSPQQMEQLIRRGNPSKTDKKKVDLKLAKEAMTPLKGNTTKICGLKTIELRMPHELASQQAGNAAVNPKALNANIKPYDMTKWHLGDEDIWMASDIFLPVSVVDFLGQKMQAAPGSAPGAGRDPILRTVHVGRGGSPAMALDTTACKKVPVTAQLFDLPKGYVKTENEMALLMGVDDSDMDILGSSSSSSLKKRMQMDGSEKLGQAENKKVTEGMAAPDFTLFSQTGAPVSLHNYIGKNPVVLYFYVKDASTVCCKEACSFRDNIKTFKGLDATIIGISADSVESHKQFVQKYNLPFILVSDQDNAVRNLYGVPKDTGLPGRVTFVIAKDGKVKRVFSSQFFPERHVPEALASLKQRQTAK